MRSGLTAYGRAVPTTAQFSCWGAGIRAAKLPEMPMTDIAPRLAELLIGIREVLPAQK